MTLDALIMLAGAFVAALPFLGFPNSWDNVLFFLAGVFIISLGIVVRRRRGSIYGEQSRTTTLTTGGGSPKLPERNSGTSNENPPHVGN